MSSFPGICREFPGVSMDRFDRQNLRSSVFLLSHCHEGAPGKGNVTLTNFLVSSPSIELISVSFLSFCVRLEKMLYRVVTGCLVSVSDFLPF